MLYFSIWRNFDVYMRSSEEIFVHFIQKQYSKTSVLLLVSVCLSTIHSVSKTVSQSVIQSVSQAVGQSVCHSISRLLTHSLKRSISHSFIRTLTSQSHTQSTKRSPSKSVTWSLHIVLVEKGFIERCQLLRIL